MERRINASVRPDGRVRHVPPSLILALQDRVEIMVNASRWARHFYASVQQDSQAHSVKRWSILAVAILVSATIPTRAASDQSHGC